MTIPPTILYKISTLSALFAAHDRYRKTEISRLFLYENALTPSRNGSLRSRRPSISMTTDASLNARRLGAIDRPLASPYSTSEIPGLSVTTTIYRRLLNVDPPSTGVAPGGGFVVTTIASQERPTSFPRTRELFCMPQKIIAPDMTFVLRIY